MKRLLTVMIACALCLAAVRAEAQNGARADAARAGEKEKPSVSRTQLVTDAELRLFVERTAGDVMRRFPALKPENLAITLVDLNGDATRPRAGSYHGDVPIYPASVVKMFYLAAAHEQMEQGKLSDTPELRRALRDMIVDSSNDATHYVLDVLTGTTSGAELPAAEMREWARRRNEVNRLFASRGYERINVNQKPWCEGPYGRERLFVQDAGQSAVAGASNNRNQLTTDATARLLAEIATGRAVSSARSGEMMELLKRDPYATGANADPDDQSRGFTGRAVSGAMDGAAAMPGVRLWSKAGWTSTTRHDAAYIELPNGRRFVLVTFTTEHANERDIIPAIARAVITRFEAQTPAPAAASRQPQ